VYRKAVIAAIKYDKGLNILYYIPSNHRIADLPLWVPDWSDPAWPEGDARSSRDYHFTAGGRDKSKWRFTDNDKKLVISGKLIDTVIFCTEPLAATNASETPR